MNLIDCFTSELLTSINTGYLLSARFDRSKNYHNYTNNKYIGENNPGSVNRVLYHAGFGPSSNHRDPREGNNKTVKMNTKRLWLCFDITGRFLDEFGGMCRPSKLRQLVGRDHTVKMHTKRQKFTRCRKYAGKMATRRETRKTARNTVHTHENAKTCVSRAREHRRKAFSR